MARIIAGTYGGRRLTPVPGKNTRPTSDRVKESLFSRLEGINAIDNAVVVDLFAGSGALGLEAVSRGARSLESVDLSEQAYRSIKRNLSTVTASASVVKSDASRYLRTRQDALIELLFLDPPYDLSEQDLATVLRAAVPQLDAAATVVVERSSRSPEPSWPTGLQPFHSKTYGSSVIWLAEPTGEDQHN